MSVLNNDTLDDPILDDETVDFSGGVYSAQRKNRLATNMLARLQNAVIDASGRVVTRRGSGKVGTDAASAFHVLGMAYIDTPALEWLVRVVQAAGVRKFQKHDSDNATAWQDVALPGGWTIADAAIELVPALDKIYLFNGTDNARSWDGAAFVDLGNTANDAPLGSIAVWFQYRMFATAVAASPDTVFYCDVLDPSAGHWNHAAKSFRVGSGDGDPIVGLAGWVATLLVIFKRSSIWLSDVNPTLSLGAQIPIEAVHNSIGCLSHRSIQRVGNDLFFLADDGIRTLNRVAKEKQLVEIGDPMSAPVRDLMLRLNKAAASTANAISYESRYFIALPLDGATQPNYILVYNTLIQAWEGYWTGLTPTVFARSSFGGTTRLQWGQTDGRVLQWRDWVQPLNETSADYEDDGTVIATNIGLRSHNFQQPKNDKKGLVVELEFDENRATAVTVTAFRDESDTAEVLATIASGLSAGIVFPIAFPLTFPAPGIKREPITLDGLDPFREIAIEISAPAGKLALRCARFSAFLETMPIGR